MKTLHVDAQSQILGHVQIEQQIQLLCLYHRLRPGDAVPSIRYLARQLGVGNGVVRRAYRELRAVGILRLENRRHLVGRLTETASSETDVLHASAAQCDRLIAWAKEQRVSAIALSRLLFWQASANEAVSPSYMFVDICRLVAERSALKVAKVWSVSVAGVAVGDFLRHVRDAPPDLTAVLVNQHLYEDVMKVAGKITPRILQVKIRLDERVRRWILTRPTRSIITIVCAEDDAGSTCQAMLRLCEGVRGDKHRFQTKNASRIPDLTKWLGANQHRPCLLSPLVWETLPARVKRWRHVAPAFTEPDLLSLEGIRIAAGVLL